MCGFQSIRQAIIDLVSLQNQIIYLNSYSFKYKIFFIVTQAIQLGNIILVVPLIFLSFQSLLLLGI